MKLLFLSIFLCLAAGIANARRPDLPAPKVGDSAPKVSAKTLEEGTEIDLTKPERVTVLVFGSWT